MSNDMIQRYSQKTEYEQLVVNISSLWAQAKENAYTAVNKELLASNWQTGRYIVEFEQGGKERAEYGKQLLTTLSKDLTLKNGRGFSRSNLLYMRKFYLAFPKSETVSHILTWSHYFELLKCDDPLEMQFYMKQCIKERWKVRELKRQMKSCLFQRLAFIGRQYVMNIGSRQFKVDLVFYHCILKCYVLIDLKRAEIRHGDIGQMNLYLNYFKTEVCQPDDNPPIGIVLGARKDELLMEYALQGITNQLFTARYQLYLPKREELQAELYKLLESQQE